MSEAEDRTLERPQPGGHLLAEALQDPPDESDERLAAMAAPRASVPTALASLAAMRTDLVPAAASSSSSPSPSQAEKEEKKTSVSTSSSSPSTVDAIQRVEADLTSSLSCARHVGIPVVACKACDDAVLFQSIRGLTPFGTGSQKDVYALPASRCIAVIRPADIGRNDPLTYAQTERRLLAEVQALGIRSVTIHDIATAPDGRVGIVQDRIANAVNSNELGTDAAKRERLGQATVDDCEAFIAVLRAQNPQKHIEDLQFLISADGRLHATDIRSIAPGSCQRNVDMLKEIRGYAINNTLPDSD